MGTGPPRFPRVTGLEMVKHVQLPVPNGSIPPPPRKNCAHETIKVILEKNQNNEITTITLRRSYLICLCLKIEVFTCCFSENSLFKLARVSVKKQTSLHLVRIHTPREAFSKNVVASRLFVCLFVCVFFCVFFFKKANP